MANINFAGNAYSGEVLEDLLAYTAQGNETYENGLIHIKSGVQKKFTLPHLKIGSIIQDNVPTPTTQGANPTGTDLNAYTVSERYLEPQEFMVYTEFNPRDFEEYWRPFQPEGPLVFRDLDPAVQTKMLRLLIDKKDQYINDCIWAGKIGGVGTDVVNPTGATQLGGASAAGPMKYFDGFLSRVLKNTSTGAAASETASGTVKIAGSTALATGANVEAALNAMWKSCPSHVRKNKKLKFVMGWDVWDLYDQYLSTQTYKYSDNEEINNRRFKGKEIVVIDGVPESTIALGKFSSDTDSCLWMAVDYSTDEESVKVERLQANSELYFFQMRMKMDVNIVLPDEIVVWTNYANAVSSGS